MSHEKALDTIFTTHYHTLVSWCRRRIWPGLGDPEDLVHLAYLRCRRNWRASRCSEHNELGFLYRCLRWAISDAARQQHRRGHKERCMAHSEASGSRSVALRRIVVEEAITSLPKSPQQVCLGLLAGKTPDQLCQELGWTKNALAVYLSRAKAELTKSLELCCDKSSSRPSRVRRPTLPSLSPAK